MAIQDHLAAAGGGFMGGQNQNGWQLYAAPSQSQQAPASDVNAAGAAQDPFGYTMGSLLTPWTKTFQAPTAAPSSSGGGGGGPAPAPAPGFNFAFGGYNAPNIDSFQLGELFAAPSAPFQGGRVMAPTPFEGGRVADAPGFAAPVGAYNPAAFQGAGAFQTGPAYSAERFAAPEAFKAPDLIDDPGYQIRLKRGEDALLNQQASRGLLRNGGTMRALMDYNQDSASQEYAAAYGRAKGEYDTAANLALAAYDRNAAAGRDEATINFDQRLAGYNANAQNARDVYDRNYQAGLTANEQTYNRSASEYDRAQQNRLAIDEINYGRGASEADRRFQQNFAVDEANYNRSASEYDRTFANARDVYQMNAQNRLAAHQLNSQNALESGRLGWDIASGTYDRNYQNYATGFQVDEQRRQQAAAMAAAGAGAGRAEEQQAYNRALTQYQMEYDQYQQNQTNQFNRLYQLAALGQGAAAQTGAFGGQYAGNAGNYYTGAGNAMAAGQVGAGNAWQSAFGGAGNAAMMYLAANGMGGNQGYTYPV